MHTPTSIGIYLPPFLPRLCMAMDVHAPPNIFPLNRELTDNPNFLLVLETLPSPLL